MAQVEELRALLSAIESERDRARSLRRTISISITLLFALFAFSIYGQFSRFDRYELERRMNAKASTLLWPEIASQIDHLSDLAIPRLNEAMSLEIASLGPRVETTLNLHAQRAEENARELVTARLASSFIQEEMGRSEAFDLWRPTLGGTPVEQESLTEILSIQSQVWAELKLGELLAPNVATLERLNEEIQLAHDDPTRQFRIFMEILDTDSAPEAIPNGGGQ